jgi:hypothetical protein
MHLYDAATPKHPQSGVSYVWYQQQQCLHSPMSSHVPAGSNFSPVPQNLQDSTGSASFKAKPQSGGLVKEFKATLGFSSVAQRNKALQKDFIAEMRLLARLRHPCIISVMGAVVEKVYYAL